MTRRNPIRCLAAGAALFAWAIAAPAADDAHRNDDIAKHRQIAQAHADAERCLKSVSSSGVNPADCAAKLQQACRGIAVGERCGLRSRTAEDKDITRRLAEHQAMAVAHMNAAQCLESGRPHDDCNMALSKDCGKIGVGKYCGMRHSH